MEFEFLKERLERFLAIIPESYKIADEIRKSPKGLSVVLERDLTAAKKPPKPKPVAPESKESTPADEGAETESPTE